MSIGIGLLEIVVFAIFVSAVFSSAKKRRQYSSYSTSAKKGRTFSKVNTMRNARVLPKQDLIHSYSSKNKECHEKEVMVSTLDEKPKRRKSLWNEPSWDDELYS